MTIEGSKILFSGHNLLTPQTAVFQSNLSVYSQTEVARNAGFDGVNLSTTRKVVEDINEGKVTQEEIEAIGVMSTSFRGEHGLSQTMRAIVKEPSRALNFGGAYLTLPNVPSSVAAIEALQLSHNINNIPVVLQPPFKTAYEVNGIRNRSIIVSPELATEMSVNSAIELGAKLSAGNMSICLDPFHLRRPDSKGNISVLAEWQKSIPALLPFSTSINISLHRTDIPSGKVDTEGEFKDLYYGEKFRSKTQIVNILRFIRSHLEKNDLSIPITIQIPYTAVSAITGSRLPSITQIENVNITVLKNVRSIMTN